MGYTFTIGDWKFENSVQHTVRRCGEVSKHVGRSGFPGEGHPRGVDDWTSRAAATRLAHDAPRTREGDRQLPLSLRAFYEDVGEVNPSGIIRRLIPHMGGSRRDPLVVYALSEEAVEEDEDGDESSAVLTIAPDDLHKAKHKRRLTL